jgi:hypothetical protein
MNELTTKQNEKTVSLCFMNNETFKQLVDGKTETELATLANNIYLSALKVVEDSNKSYGILKRQLDKMDKESVVYKIGLKKLERINETIENMNKQLDLLENEETKEFCWIKYMINYCLGNLNAIEEEEE